MRFALTILIGLLLTCHSMVAWSQTFKQKITPPNWPYSAIGYYEYLPKGYEASADKKYPVIFFFHGISERGNGTSELKFLLRNGIPQLISKGQNFPFIIIAPQLRKNHADWYPFYMNEVVEYARKTLRIDDTRIYITGLSLGGGGAWGYAEVFPEKVAAVAPVCGHYNDPAKACSVYAKNHIPIWVFHGALDKTVSIDRSRMMIDALNDCSDIYPKPIFTVYEKVGHDSWNYAYRNDHTLHNPNLYEWFLQQQKKN
jgi:predicted peptidase